MTIDFLSLEETEDPCIRVLSRGEGMVEYYTESGERWKIYGTCSACGECETGVVNASYQNWTGVPIGQPGACLDTRFGTRKDVPVRPNISTNSPHCTLTGEYIV